MSPFFEHLKLNLQFIGFSKKLAIITIIGLSISVAMVTENILFLDSFRYNAFEEFQSRTTDAYIEAQMDNAGTVFLGILNQLGSSVTSAIGDLELNLDYIEGQNWFPYKFFYLMLNNLVESEIEFHDTYLVGLDSSFFASLQDIMTVGNAPGFGEYCIISNSKTLDETNLEINTIYEGYVPVDDSGNAWRSFAEGIPLAGTYFNFTGIINIDELTFGEIELPTEIDTVVNMVLNLGAEIILTDIGEVFSTVDQIGRTGPDPYDYVVGYGRNDLSILGRITFDLREFDVFELNDIIDGLQALVNRMQEDFINILDGADGHEKDYSLHMNSRIIPLLSNFRTEFRIFQIFLMLFMLPTLGMALALTSFATNQVKKQRDMHIQNLHQRGASRKMLFGLMLSELFIYAIIAVLIGGLIGWPFTMVALKSEGFFIFTGPWQTPNLSLLITAISLSVGFGIAFLTNVFSLWRRTKSTVEEALQEQVEKKPFWERFYVDILLLVLGIIMWIVATQQLNADTTTAVEFAFYFAAPAPILIITGGILFATRIYPYIVNGLSNVIFKIPKIELSAVSARNAIRRKGSTSRTIILMTITFALTVATMIIPDSYRAFDLEDAYYTLGTDIVVTQVDVLTPNYKATVEAIEGVKETSYVGVLELSNGESDLLYQIRLMGVELDNYSKVVYQEPEYTSGRGIQDILNSINDTWDVVGQRDQIDLLALGDNDTFVIENTALDGANVVTVEYPVKLVDYYDYWPTLYTEKPDMTSKTLHIGLLCNISTLFNISRNDFDVQGFLFVTVEDGYGIYDVARQIEIDTQHEALNVEELLLISEGTLKSTVLFGALNVSFIFSMLISSATLITMMFINALEREKEIAVMKSMGITARQLFTFFFTEAIIILTFTMIIGVALGFGTSVMLMKVLRIGSVFPPHEMIYPVGKIIWTTTIVFVTGLLSTIVPIIVNSRKKIGGALKSV
ncbi:MAG: FtsX-like permease family protein [Candidatus Heimdallarchaeota archaeon]